MQKQDLTLNNEQWLICHKTKPNQTNLVTNATDKSHQKTTKKSLQNQFGDSNLISYMF